VTILARRCPPRGALGPAATSDSHAALRMTRQRKAGIQGCVVVPNAPVLSGPFMGDFGCRRLGKDHPAPAAPEAAQQAPSSDVRATLPCGVRLKPYSVRYPLVGNKSLIAPAVPEGAAERFTRASHHQRRGLCTGRSATMWGKGFSVP